MQTDLLCPEEIDARFSWPPGRTSRLSKSGKLPYYVLPDGSIRLQWEEVTKLIQHISPSAVTGDHRNG